MGVLGQLVPILIRDDEIIDGHRRFAAARRLGWSDLLYIRKPLLDCEALAAQIRLNHLTVNENRRAIICLIEKKDLDSLPDLCYSIGRNIDWVASVLGLQELCPLVRRAVEHGSIDIRVAMLLAKLPKPRQRELLTDTIDLPAQDLLPRLQDEVRHTLEKIVNRRTQRKTSTTLPLLRSEKEIFRQTIDPAEAMATITRDKATTALDGWNLALCWALRLDTKSMRDRIGEKNE